MDSVYIAHDHSGQPMDYSGHCPWTTVDIAHGLQWTLPMDSVDIAHGLQWTLPMDSVDIAHGLQWTLPMDYSGHFP